VKEHQHDLDLIASYAEGWSDRPEEAARLIEQCPICRADYHAQREVKRLISSLPSLRLDPEEAAGLRQALAGGVPARVVSISDRRRAQLWLRLGTVAAGLVVLVGLSSLLVRLSGGAASGELGIEALSEPTTAAAAAATTTVGDAAFPAAESEGGATFRLAGGDADAVRAEIERLLEASRADTLTYSQLEDDQVRRCAERLEGRPVAAAALSSLNGRSIVIYILDDDDQPEAIVYDQATCEVVDLE
jgi:hypothetical protein